METAICIECDAEVTDEEYMDDTTFCCGAQVRIVPIWVEDPHDYYLDYLD